MHVSKIYPSHTENHRALDYILILGNLQISLPHSLREFDEYLSLRRMSQILMRVKSHWYVTNANKCTKNRYFHRSIPAQVFTFIDFAG